MTEVIVGNQSFVVLDQPDPLGARPDHAHVPAQDIQELGKLVQPGPAEKRAEGVTLASPTRV